MKIDLLRFHGGKYDTLGLLYVDGQFACFTLEDEPRDVKVAGETRIPAGSYKLALKFSPSMSPKYGHDMIHIQDVPGFEGIYVHRGNTETDTRGCILVGDSAHFSYGGRSRILESTQAYARVYDIVSDGILAGETTLCIASVLLPQSLIPISVA